MAGALLAGIIRSDIIEAEKILISEPRQERRDLLKLHYGAMITDDNREVAQKAGTIIIAVKPQEMDAVLGSISECLNSKKLVISIVAGVTIKKINSVHILSALGRKGLPIESPRGYSKI